MSISVRDGSFDVVIAAAPRVTAWPSVGVRALSQVCSEMGLTVGLFGGSSLQVQGVIPLESTGAVVLAQDVQGRIHRLYARSVVKINPALTLPDPFPGWRSQGLIPLATAQRMFKEARFPWHPVTVVLGTGNPALRFASSLLEKQACSEVYCIESHGRWGNKDYAGWEVEKRRFELLGGRILHARLLELRQKSALLWELKLQDKRGYPLIQVARVVAAGPFWEFPFWREHPPGSLLFEMESTSEYARKDHPEGWEQEKALGTYLGTKIVRSLKSDLGLKRKKLQRLLRQSRQTLRQLNQHREEPYQNQLQGKWLSDEGMQKVRAFSGVPQKLDGQSGALKASIECLESITCTLCADACPEQAIDIQRAAPVPTFLLEDKCTGCGVCLEACPSRVPVMLNEKKNHPYSKLILPWSMKGHWEQGDLAMLLNRAGKPLASARVAAVDSRKQMDLISVDVPSHLLWQARGLRVKKDDVQDDAYLFALKQSESMKAETVEITLNGKRRLVREGIPVAVALLESGWSRPSEVLLCDDGSCRLCRITVDGSIKLACQTRTHAGMGIRMEEPQAIAAESHLTAQIEEDLCPCKKISSAQVVESIATSKPSSPDAVLSQVPVGSGRCHGQLCMGAFRRLLESQGVNTREWIDWRFPWTDWPLTSGPT